MANFTGQLRSNEIFTALYNMIISQQVFADNIKGTYSDLVDKARVDGGLYGDTKLYYATDCLASAAWGNDAEAENLLALHRPKAPECQAIVLDTFRQISLTVDDYLSKRAWGTADAFASFTSVMKGWLRDTKRIYDSKLYNAFIGTTETNVGSQTQIMNAGTADANFGLKVAEKLANILTELKDASREYNDYGFMRSYDESDLMVVWNSEIYNAIKKIDLPVVFHKEGLLDEFDQNVLPAKYFGIVNPGQTTGNDTGAIRSLIEQTIGDKHFFPGDIIPAGVSAPAGTSYTVKDDIAFKVIHKRSVPYMSAFEVGTSFFNPKSLTTNHYLTFGHNKLEYLKNYPLITVKTND